MLQYSAKASGSWAGFTSMEPEQPWCQGWVECGHEAGKDVRVKKPLLGLVLLAPLEMKPQYPKAGPASPKPRLVHSKMLDFLG